jgi:hypothetical protein
MADARISVFRGRRQHRYPMYSPSWISYGCNGFEVTLGGDCELETMIRALKFITKVLEEESEEVYD